jgi:hypothetical protein
LPCDAELEASLDSRGLASSSICAGDARGTLVPTLVVVGFLVIGALYFVGKLLFDRKSLVVETSTVTSRAH